MTSAPPRNNSTSLRRALDLLGYARDHPDAARGLALTTIAEDLGMSKSTILRLSAPLMEADLLLRDRETGWFRLGPGALRLGQAYQSPIDLRTVAREPLRRLLQAAHETCHLVVYDPPDVVYIHKVEDEQTVRMSSRIGSRVPTYRTAVGKAILAWLGKDALQAVIDVGLPAVTERTTTDPGRLRAELERVRRRGYAVDDRENEPEVRCVAAPIFRLRRHRGGRAQRIRAYLADPARPGTQDRADDHLQELRRDFAACDAVYRSHFTPPFPVRTTVGPDLMDIMVEIDLVAYLGG
jgi:IclR family acetate operon transcriptional repressor